MRVDIVVVDVTVCVDQGILNKLGESCVSNSWASISVKGINLKT